MAVTHTVFLQCVCECVCTTALSIKLEALAVLFISFYFVMTTQNVHNSKGIVMSDSRHLIEWPSDPDFKMTLLSVIVCMTTHLWAKHLTVTWPAQLMMQTVPSKSEISQVSLIMPPLWSQSGDSYDHRSQIELAGWKLIRSFELADIFKPFTPALNFTPCGKSVYLCEHINLCRCECKYLCVCVNHVQTFACIKSYF